MRKCDNCGAILNDNIKFCSSCGALIDEKIKKKQPENKEQKNKPSKKTLIISLLLIVVGGLIIVFINRFSQRITIENPRKLTPEKLKSTLWMCDGDVESKAMYFDDKGNLIFSYYNRENLLENVLITDKQYKVKGDQLLLELGDGKEPFTIRLKVGMNNNQLQILSKSEDLQFLCGVYKLATFKQVTTATPAAEKIYSFIEREKEKQENQKKAALERKEQEKKEAEKKEKKSRLQASTSETYEKNLKTQKQCDVYWIYDVNNDDVDDLIISTGTCTANKKIQIYTVNPDAPNTVEMIAEYNGSRVGAKDENGDFCLIGARQGYIALYRVDPDTLELEELFNGGGIGWDTDDYERVESEHGISSIPSKNNPFYRT